MRLTTDIGEAEGIPYFLWDEPLTVAELKRRLRESEPEERARLAGKVLRESRFGEAMALVPLSQLLSDYPRIRRHLGRRRAFWDYLLGEWRALGLVD